MYSRLGRLPVVPFALASMLVVTLIACERAEESVEGSGAASEPRMETITGTLSYEEEIALAPESMVTVQLLDLSNTAAPTVVAENVFQVPGKPPLPFSIPYDANSIGTGRPYSLRAEVKEQKRLMFVSDTAYPVLQGESQPPVDILLKRVPGGRLDRMPEHVRANNPEFSGFYRYVDDHGEFVDCSDGGVHPVAREEAIFALEAEYRDVVRRYGDEVFLRVAGKYMTRPARGGQGKEDYLVVMQVEEMSADGDCP